MTPLLIADDLSANTVSLVKITLFVLLNLLKYFN